jgi:hypothetical protein
MTLSLISTHTYTHRGEPLVKRELAQTLEYMYISPEDPQKTPILVRVRVCICVEIDR